MGPSDHRRGSEPLLRRDEHDEYEEDCGNVSSVLEENARLRGLVRSLSTIILRHFAEQG
jgi:hypothetical protein